MGCREFQMRMLAINRAGRYKEFPNPPGDLGGSSFVHNTWRQPALSAAGFRWEESGDRTFPVSPSPGGAQVREFILIA